MKKILLSLVAIVAVAGVVAGVTIAFYNDTETSAGNIFVAGSVDLKVDHTKQTYNDHECVGNCEEIGSNLVVNGGFETPDVSTGGWAIYPDASQTSWTVESGAGLEIQDHAAGDPHSGNQLAELDSNNSSVISQTLSTVAGQQYRLTFWYSPRPNRPAGDNTIGAMVKVVSDSTILVNDTIGATSAGGSQTSWQEFTYNFIATDNSTKVIFSDLGTNNSYGGYLDDISVKELECSSQFEGVGACTLWGERDLGQGDTFFNFDDIKPGDHGTNVISLHVYSNNAYACLITSDQVDDENIVYESETGDNTPDVGELSQYMNVFTWEDTDGDGLYESGESQFASGSLSNLSNLMSLDSASQQFLTATTTKYIGLAWCAGTLIVGSEGDFTCDGSGMLNDAQSDSFSASLTAYAEQIRNNSGFLCSGVELPSNE
ncbi:MAG: hypothetical protein A3B89_00865 [Candidatus Buchananbacteria bacterium RIFCSPHIGHO2_02_FULL_40_13]|uniref:MAM domain-containing protein n=1 Tax=Candidatus Buchananbacteria bacterium RIFCSPLOWO2_01_FULL_39_33 TaxID=1797543 RepID=A0A1G1YH40_9BACT|nr:MAG: hypothetical protein A2820_00930 [Candidatus Buchananbacteria bacterium RIFCSPHIGHO2_01_FULL_40_35]OGY50424.1 MAG: hypothetical protein A3B89_00865 [Candidatus Buchananbacteria bacterium RIFCSPHIGHO2_02_FULL_40_13]OGY51564.1 MAG: hypothetical protein A3A02_02020 [Candidatus Buchananbacteria bacterium RIFCSPLOWO2_01_FULL_39_33]